MIPTYAALISVATLSIQRVWRRRGLLVPESSGSNASTSYLSKLKYSLQQQTWIAIFLRTLRLFSNIILLVISMLAFIQYNGSIPFDEEARKEGWQSQNLGRSALIEAFAVFFYVRALPKNHHL